MNSEHRTMNRRYRRLLSLIVAEVFVCSTVLPAWTTPLPHPESSTLRPVSSRDGGLNQLKEELGANKVRAGDGGNGQVSAVLQKAIARSERIYPLTIQTLGVEELGSVPALQELKDFRNTLTLEEAMRLYWETVKGYAVDPSTGKGRYEGRDPVTLYAELSKWYELFSNKLTTFYNDIQRARSQEVRKEDILQVVEGGRIVLMLHYPKEQIDAGTLTSEEAKALYAKAEARGRRGARDGGQGVFARTLLAGALLMPATTAPTLATTPTPTASDVVQSESTHIDDAVVVLAKAYLTQAVIERKVQLILASDRLQTWQAVAAYMNSPLDAEQLGKFMNALYNRALEELQRNKVALSGNEGLFTVGRKMLEILGEKEAPQAVPLLQQAVGMFRSSLASAHSEQEVDQAVAGFERAVRGGLASGKIENPEAAKALGELTEQYLRPLDYIVEQSPLGLSDERAFVVYKVDRSETQQTDQGPVERLYVHQVTRFGDGRLRGNPGWSSFFRDYVVIFSEAIAQEDRNIQLVLAENRLPFEPADHVRETPPGKQIQRMAELSQKLLRRGLGGLSRAERIRIQEDAIASHETEHRRRTRMLNLQEGQIIHSGIEEVIAVLKSMIEGEPFHVLADQVKLAAGGSQSAWSVLGHVVERSDREEILRRLDSLAEEPNAQLLVWSQRAYAQATQDGGIKPDKSAAEQIKQAARDGGRAERIEAPSSRITTPLLSP